MSNPNQNIRIDETKLILRLISNPNNGEILQLSADRFIDRTIFSYSITESVPDHKINLVIDNMPIDLNDFIYGLRLLHPIGPLTHDTLTSIHNKCGPECFLKTIGTIRSRQQRSTILTARQLLTTFTDPERIAPMPIVCSANTFISERIGASTFEMFHPLPSNFILDDFYKEKSKRMMNILNAKSENIFFDETQVHFLREEDEMYIETNNPFKMVVNKESLLISSSYLLSIYKKSEITSEEAERIIFDVFRIFRRDIIISSFELSKLIRFYRTYSNNEYTSLSKREILTLNISLQIVEITSGLIDKRGSVFT